MWGLTFDAGRVGPVTGSVSVYVNGQRFSGDVRSIPLNNHDLIQVDVAGDVAPQLYAFPGDY